MTESYRPDLGGLQDDEGAQEWSEGLTRRPVKRPRGQIPNDTKVWLETNERDCGWEIAVCKCGRWYHQMDHLAPYHTERNWCPRCKHKQDWNGLDV